MMQHIYLLAAIGLLASICTGQNATPPSSYRVETVVNSGTITGAVKWSGPVQKDLSLPITKNPEVCDPSNRQNRNLERLEIGPDGGVANTVVFLKDIAKGKAMNLTPARQSLNQKNCR